MQIVTQSENIKYRSRVLYSMADQLYEEKKYNQAIEYYFKGIETDSNVSPRTYYNLACCFSLEKDADKGLLYFEKSLKSGFKDDKHIKEDTDLDFIRNTPKFKALMQQYFPASDIKKY